MFPESAGAVAVQGGPPCRSRDSFGGEYFSPLSTCLCLLLAEPEGEVAQGKSASRAQSRVEKGREWLRREHESKQHNNKYFILHLTFGQKQVLKYELDLVNY